MQPMLGDVGQAKADCRVITIVCGQGCSPVRENERAMKLLT
jgi:hypothetical protein